MQQIYARFTWFINIRFTVQDFLNLKYTVFNFQNKLGSLGKRRMHVVLCCSNSVHTCTHVWVHDSAHTLYNTSTCNSNFRTNFKFSHHNSLGVTAVLALLLLSSSSVASSSPRALLPSEWSSSSDSRPLRSCSLPRVSWHRRPSRGDWRLSGRMLHTQMDRQMLQWTAVIGDPKVVCGDQNLQLYNIDLYIRTCIWKNLLFNS